MWTGKEAVRIALKRVVGAYVIVLLDADNPDTIIAARKGSPLVIGVGKGEHFLASDASPIIEYTKEVVYVNDYGNWPSSNPMSWFLKKIWAMKKITPFIQKAGYGVGRHRKRWLRPFYAEGDF